MNNFKDGDIVRWFLNPSEYITGVVVEVCGDGTYWVEHSNGQQRHYKETELALHTKGVLNGRVEAMSVLRREGISIC